MKNTICLLMLFIFYSNSSFSQDKKAESRSLRLDYICYLSPIPSTGKKLDLWIPIPTSNERQKVELLNLKSLAGKITKEPKYGNFMYFQQFELNDIKAMDTLKITLSYQVIIREKTVSEAKNLANLPLKKPEKPLSVYLAENLLIPLRGAINELKQKIALPKEPIPAARKMYDYLIDTMVYNYKAPGAGIGDVVWACKSLTGDCSDYHSIFIGLCRASGIPADHVFGLPLKPKQEIGTVKDWHCWARFWVKGPKWITIDASEADKHPEQRDYLFGTLSNLYLEISHGRDVILEPAQQGQALNIFADPYAEIDGKAFEGIKWLGLYKEERYK